MKSSDVNFVVSQAWLISSYFIDSLVPIAMGLAFAVFALLSFVFEHIKSK